MASVNTNAAAITALRTLQQTNTSLDKTQNTISTGYKIGEAKDNAAYWAISTTLKSDNKSLSTVKDALGLGASTVDTAYQGLNKAKDVLDEIKSKLTAATQDGVNRDTIQSEIKQLQDQLKSIATSSVFSGENWLSVDSSASAYNANKAVVASFSRDVSGSVSIGTIKVDTKGVALYDSSTAAGAGGILNTTQSLKGKDGRDLTVGGTLATTGNTGTGGVSNASVTGALDAGAAGVLTNVTGVDATASGLAVGTGSNIAVLQSGAWTLPAGASKMTLSFQVNAGATKSVTFAVDTASLANTVTNLNNALSGTGLNAAVDFAATTKVNFYTTAAGTGASIKIMDLVTLGANGLAAQPTTPVIATGWTSYSTGTTYTAGTAYTGGASATDLTVSTSGVYKTNATTLVGANWATKTAATDQVTLNLTVDGKATSVTVAAGASYAGFIANLNNNATFAAVAKASEGVTDQLAITSGTTSTSSKVEFNSVTFADKDGKVKPVSSSGFEKIGQAAATTGNSFSALTLDNDDSIVFDINVNGASAAKTVTINKELINSTLKTTDGKITNITDYKAVVDMALTKAGVSGVATSLTNSNTTLTFTTTTAAGTGASIAVTKTAGSNGGAQISVDKIDISSTATAGWTSDQIKNVLTAYIDVVNSAINKVTSAASSLGSVASRIDLQKSFVDTLMDTIDKGVGNLIDADMSEESTKLQALQVKQQLGVQALSIANQASQSILSLFRS